MPLPTSPYQNIGELYRDYRGWLVGWLHQRLGNRADAADLTHDTFIRLLCAKPHAIDSPRAYLATVANRLLISLYRRRSLEQAWLETLAHLPEQNVPSLESQALILEALNEVDQVLSCLPARSRQAFLMAQLEGYTQVEIANRLGIQVRSVQRHLARAYEECIILATTPA